MKKILFLGMAFLLFSSLAIADMRGGVLTTSSVELQPDSYVSDLISYIDHLNRIIMFKNGMYVLYKGYGMEQLALLAINEEEYLVVHWTDVDQNGIWWCDTVTISLGE